MANDDGTLSAEGAKEVFWATEELKAILYHGGVGMPNATYVALSAVVRRLEKSQKPSDLTNS